MGHVCAYAKWYREERGKGLVQVGKMHDRQGIPGVLRSWGAMVVVESGEQLRAPYIACSSSYTAGHRLSLNFSGCMI